MGNADNAESVSSESVETGRTGGGIAGGRGSANSPLRSKGGLFGLAGAGVAAVAVAASVALGTLGVAVAATGINLIDDSYPAGTTAVADPDTMDSYKLFPTGDAGDSFDTTRYAGRLWTDKTVIVPTSDGTTAGDLATFNLASAERDFDGDGPRATAGKFEVEKTTSGTFLTSVSVLSSSLASELAEPEPLDIVLVLDLSGSMRTRNGYSGPVTTAPASVSNADPNDSNTMANGNLYCIKEDGVYRQIRRTATAGGVRYYDNVDNGKYARYYFTTDERLDGTPYGNNEDYRYALIYKRDQLPSRITELQDAAAEFLETIAENNTKLASQGYSTASMSQVAMVNFSGRYRGQGSWVTGSYTPTAYQAEARGAWNTTDTAIITPFTTYTKDGTDGTAAVEYGTNIVGKEVNPSNSTASDYGLTLASMLFDGQAGYVSNYGSAGLAGTLEGMTTDPARENAKKVVIFFTDGNPKHSGGTAPNDFQGQIAQQTIEIAEELKADDVTIYAVAMIEGANPDDLTLNANIYLNGVSSNYKNANVASSTTKSVSGFIPPAADTWVVDTSTWEGSNQGYFMVVGGETSVTDAFKQIAADITSSDAEDSTSTGRDGNTAITITDYLGDYMEFKGLDGILYGTSADETKFYAPGTQNAYAVRAQVQRDDRSASDSVYTMSYQVPSALLSARHVDETTGAVAVDNTDLSLITVQVTRSSDAKTGDTVTIKVPPQLIPSLRYIVSQAQDDEGNIQTNVTREDVDPLRIFYSVGPKAATLAEVISQMEDQALRSENANNESDRQTEAYKSFLANAASEGEDGIYSLYSNRPTIGADGKVTQPVNGEAVVDMVLSESNPYYFYVDEPLFVKTTPGNTYEKATSANATNANGSARTYYYREAYFDVNENTQVSRFVEWTGGVELRADDVYYITSGTAKTAAEDHTSTTLEKSDNATNTATAYLASVFDGSQNSTEQYVATQYLGNNGRLDIPVYGTLDVTKRFSAGRGFTLPADPAPRAEMTLALKDAGGANLTQEGTYRALIRDADGHPVDPETHAVVSNAELAKFYVVSGSRFTLLDGETIKITNLPDGATYQVVEEGMDGYKATVVNNDGSVDESAERGAGGSTAQ